MDRRPLLASVGACLRYPGGELSLNLSRLRNLASEQDATAVQEAVDDFEKFLRWRGLAALCETYTRTFDLQPSCVPYLGVHLFGDESFKRARLLTGLADAYARCGLDPGRELPDHVAVVLSWVPVASEEEWEDLARYCLVGPLDDMTTAVRSTDNPYRHLLAAAAQLVRAEVDGAREAAHA